MSNRDFYKGGLVKINETTSVPHGEGHYVFTNSQGKPSGDEYEGGFEYGEYYGNGIHKYSSGDKYEGTFYKNEKHGNGTYYWSDGSKFIGNWINDNESSGVYYNPNGTLNRNL